MAWHGKGLGELLDELAGEFGEHHYGRVDLEATAAQKQKAVEWFSNGCTRILGWPVCGRETLDGVKLYLGEIGWVKVRASGTENLLRIYSETSRADSTRRVLELVAGTIREL